MLKENATPMPPKWVMVLGSIAILFHLFCAFITPLFMTSGPWPIPGGGSVEWLAPEFAITAGSAIAEPYRQALKSTYHFRFPSIKQEQLEISMEVILRNAAGTVTARRTFPDPEAPASIRFRQMLMVQQLGNDIPMDPQAGVKLAAPGQTLPKLRWWQSDGERHMVLKEADPNEVPRNQSFMTPSPIQYTVAKSFARYLARNNAQQKVELVRAWHDPLLPMVLIQNEAPTADLIRPFQSSYGELPQ